MYFRNKKVPLIVKNGADDAFSIRSACDDRRDAIWWADTCYLVHALSDGDLSDLKAALLKIGEGSVAVLTTTMDSVVNQLYGRLVYLGYTLPVPEPEPVTGPDTLSGDRPEKLRAFLLTACGIERIPSFLSKQQAQLQLHGGSPEPIVEFAGNFLGMNEHHRSLPTDVLEQFRILLASRDAPIEIESGSAREELLRVYETLGILEATAPFSWIPSVEATMNAPFLLDILLQERATA